MNFKKILKIIGTTLLSIFVISSFFFIKDYIDKNKKYNEFKEKVEVLTIDNEKYISDNTSLLAKTSQYEKDNQELNKKLAEKKTEIVYKEKIVYKDGQLIIPEDYNELKNGYATLSSIYLDQKELNDFLEKKSKEDDKLIFDLSDALETTTVQLKQATDMLNNIPDKPVKFITSSILLSSSINSDSKYDGGVGYMLTIKDKVHVGTLISYPLRAQIFVGIKL